MFHLQANCPVSEAAPRGDPGQADPEREQEFSRYFSPPKPLTTSSVSLLEHCQFYSAAKDRSFLPVGNWLSKKAEQ